MKRLFISITIISCLATLAVLLTVQSAVAQGKLEGVWRVSEVWFSTDSNAGKLTVAPTHPSLIIFTKKHFSFLNIAAVNPQRDLPQKDSTDAQKVAAWTPFVAFAGTYEVKGNIFTSRNIIAKDPSAMMLGNFTTNEFIIEGDTLITTPKTNQDGPIANPIITKFVRVE